MSTRTRIAAAVRTGGFVALSFALLGPAGCGNGTPSAKTASSSNTAPATSGAPQGTAAANPQTTEQPTAPPVRRPLSLPSFGGTETATGDATASGSPSKKLTGEARTGEVRKQLRPLQVLVSAWEGKTFKQYNGVGVVDEQKWAWDLQDRAQPALLLTSDKSPFFRTAKITYLPEKSKFRMVTSDAKGTHRNFEGDFAEPVRDMPGEDGRKLERRYKLQFRQTAEQPESGGEAPADRWQVVFNQQENNRYLIEIRKQRPSTGEFDVPVDTVASQRLGTSFALSDTDYGERTCIISQGLGTATVSYKGKTYYVCCSGCEAAFKDDPELWIAKAEARAKEKTP